MSRDYIRDVFAAVTIIFAVTLTAVCQTPQSTTQAPAASKAPEILQLEKPQSF